MDENRMELDFSKKLEITINNERPVTLADMTMSLFAFSEQFHRFIETESNVDQRIGSELYIKEVRSGSIVVELIVQAAPILPLVWHGGTLLEWFNQTQGIIEWMLGKVNNPPRELTKHDLKQWHSILEPVAKDRGSQMNINVCGDNTVIQHLTVTSDEANVVQNQAIRMIESMETADGHVQRMKVMHWRQSKFDLESKTGDLAVIESISKKAIKVVLENNAVKAAMLAGDHRFNKQWHELAYLVDVDVQTIEGKPKVYTILKYYPEDAFDPDY